MSMGRGIPTCTPQIITRSSFPKPNGNYVIAPAACPGLRSGGAAEDLVREFKAKVFPKREVRYVRMDAHGKKVVVA